MKIDRVAVHAKYNGHCAYCGKVISRKDMQVDHIRPLCNGGMDDIDNLNPSCRRCNHYKRGGDIETLRWLLSEMYRKLSTIYIFQVAQDYGMVEWHGWDGRFYFEKEAEQ